MAQDKEREMINSATEAAQQLIDVIFDINCAANKWPSYAARALPLANTLPPWSENI